MLEAAGAAGAAEPRSLKLGRERPGRPDRGRGGGPTPVELAALAKLVAMVAAAEVAQSAAKEVLAELVEKGGDPAALLESLGLGRAGRASSSRSWSAR